MCVVIYYSGIYQRRPCGVSLTLECFNTNNLISSFHRMFLAHRPSQQKVQVKIKTAFLMLQNSTSILISYQTCVYQTKHMCTIPYTCLPDQARIYQTRDVFTRQRRVYQTKHVYTRPGTCLPDQARVYHSIHVFTRPDTCLSDQTRVYQTRDVNTRPNTCIPDQARIYQTRNVFTRPDKCLSDQTRIYQTRHVFTRPNTCLPDQTRVYQSGISSWDINQ